MRRSFPSPTLSLSLSLSLCVLLIACEKPPPQTGQRVIAAAVRALLDQSYAGIDYPTYRDSLKDLEALTAQHLDTTPFSLRPLAEQMLDYLRTAEEILRWQTEQGKAGLPSSDDKMVKAWVERYPFLRAAIGAHTANVFDVPTALTLLWDKTNTTLPAFQMKSKPL